MVRYVTETRPERQRLKKEKEEKTLEHLRRVVEVQNIFSGWILKLLVEVQDHFCRNRISKYATLDQGRVNVRHSFCDPEYDRARSEVEGKVYFSLKKLRKGILSFKMKRYFFKYCNSNDDYWIFKHLKNRCMMQWRPPCHQVLILKTKNQNGSFALTFLKRPLDHCLPKFLEA